MLDLAMRAVNPSYDPLTGQMQVAIDAFFKNWQPGMKNSNIFSYGVEGSTNNAIKLAMVQFRDATIEPFIASGGFDTNHNTQESVAFNTLTPRCGGAITWTGPNTPNATFDGYNCFVENFQSTMIQDNGYIWNNGWHYRVNTNLSSTCPLDGAQPWGNQSNECYAGHPPAGKDAFIFNNAFYFTP